jgi:hypothetical protein
MSIAIAVIALIVLTAIGRVAWGAILVGRDYNAGQQH